MAKKHWHYLLRFKKGSIPGIYEEYETVRKIEKNYETEKKEKKKVWYDYVEKIDYREYQVTVAEYGEEKGLTFCFVADIPVTKKNIKKLIEDGTGWQLGCHVAKRHSLFEAANK